MKKLLSVLLVILLMCQLLSVGIFVNAENVVASEPFVLTDNASVADASAVRLITEKVAGRTDLRCWELERGPAADMYDNIQIQPAWYTMSIPASELEGYNVFQFYVKISDAAGVNSQNLNLSFGLAYDGGFDYDIVDITGISAAAAAADWVKVNVAFDSFARLASATSITNYMIRLSDRSAQNGICLKVSDFLVANDNTPMGVTVGWKPNYAEYPIIESSSADNDYNSSLKAWEVTKTAPSTDFWDNFQFIYPWYSQSTQVSSLKGYNYLQFYIKLDSENAVMGDNIHMDVAFEYGNDFDFDSRTVTINDISVAKVAAGWTQVNIPLSSFPGLSEATNLSNMRVRLFNRSTSNGGSFYISEAVAVRSIEAQQGVTVGWTPDVIDYPITEASNTGNRYNPEVKAWRVTKTAPATDYYDIFQAIYRWYSQSVAVSSLSDYLEFYIKLSDANIVAGPNINMDVSFAFDNSYEFNHTVNINNVSAKEAATGWAKVTVPVSSFGDISGYQYITNVLIRVWDRSASNAGDFYFTEMVTVKESKTPVSVSAGWQVEGATSESVAANDEHFAFTAWSQTKQNPAADMYDVFRLISPWYCQYTKVSRLSGFDAFEFYVKLDSKDAVWDETLDINFSICVSDDLSLKSYRVEGISAADAAAGWTKVTVPFSAFPELETADSILNICIELWKRSSYNGGTFSASEVFAVKSEKAPKNVTPDASLLDAGIVGSRCEYNVFAEDATLGGWELFKYMGHAGVVEHTFTFNALQASAFEGYTHLEWYVTVDNVGAITTDNLNLQLDAKFADETVTTVAPIQTVSKNEAANWVKVSVKLSDILTNDLLCGLTVRLSGCDTNQSLTFGISDIEAVKVLSVVTIDESSQTVYKADFAQPFIIKGADSVLDGFVIEYLCGDEYTTAVPVDIGAYNVRITRAADSSYSAYEKIIENGYEIEEFAYTSSYEFGEYVTGIEVGTSVEEFITDFNITNGYVSTSATVIGTGAVVTVYDNNDIIRAEAQVVICGDIDGDGYVNAGDVTMLRIAILTETGFEGAAQEAADLKSDEVLNILDLIRAKKLASSVK